MNRILYGLAEHLGPGKKVRVGFLVGSTCGREHQASAPTVAFLLEFGTKFMPARPFFRNMIARRSPKWGKLLAAALTHTKFNSEATLQLVGMKIAEQLQQSIEEFKEPDITQETKNRKGFDTPLQDSKNMKRAVDFEVSEGVTE